MFAAESFLGFLFTGNISLHNCFKECIFGFLGKFSAGKKSGIAFEKKLHLSSTLIAVQVSNLFNIALFFQAIGRIRNSVIT